MHKGIAEHLCSMLWASEWPKPDSLLPFNIGEAHLWAPMYALLPCRVLQYITIRKEEEEMHTAIEAGLPDEDIGKLARISHRVRRCQLHCWWCFMRADSSRPMQSSGHSWAAGSILGWGIHVPSPPLPCKTRALKVAGQHNPCEGTLGLIRRRTRR